jgi:hypothetical protein
MRPGAMPIAAQVYRTLEGGAMCRILHPSRTDNVALNAREQRVTFLLEGSVAGGGAA